MRALAILCASTLLFGCGSSSSDDGGDASTNDTAPNDATNDAPKSDTTNETGADVAPDGGPTETIHFIGRFDTSDAAGPKFEWSASAVVARFTGTGIDVKLSDGGNDLFEVVIDGTTSVLTATSGTQSYPLASGLAAGTHDVVLYRRTEAFFGTTQFLGFTVTGGALVPTPVPYAHTIELVGDSITCGYGDEGAGPSCSFTNTTENEWLSYGALAARALNAAQITVAWSGKGIYRNYGGDTSELMPVLWDRTLPTDASSAWGFKSYVPDVVVIDLGTNDFSSGDPGTPFQDAWVSFLTKVRGKYPSAFVFAAVGPMLSGTSYTQDKTYIQAAIDARKSAGDTKLGLVELPTQDPADGLGCDYHPSLKTHQKMADVLTATIKAQMGW